MLRTQVRADNVASQRAALQAEARTAEQQRLREALSAAPQRQHLERHPPKSHVCVAKTSIRCLHDILQEMQHCYAYAASNKVQLHWSAHLENHLYSDVDQANLA